MFVLHTEQPVLLMRTCTGQQIHQVFLVLIPPKPCQRQIHGELNLTKNLGFPRKRFSYFYATPSNSSENMLDLFSGAL